MNAPRLSDAQISRALRAHVPDRVPAGSRERILDEIHRTRQRPVFGPWRTRFMFRTAFGAAAVVVVIAIGGAIVIQRSQPGIGGPSPTTGPSASPSQAAVAVPSATPTATQTPLLWNQASLEEDWPAPVRTEPAGGAIVLPFGFPEPPDRMPARDTYPDPSGDTGLPVLPWVDIRELSVGLGGRVTIGLANNVPPAVDPTDQWIAYGVVIDADRDGVPDWRYGIDNMPVDATGERPHRAWITDLHTGRTESNAGGPNGFVGKTFFDTSYPGEPPGQMTILEFGGGDVVGGGSRPGQVHPFYAWASVIQDGRVVATDYAPDVGWLDPDANP